MRTLIALGFACALMGCSFGGYVADSSSDYNDTLADVANKQLVINILRARDNLPLEFSDLSQIRGSIQGTAALQPTAPFGPLRASTTRTSDGGTLSVQLNPTFDIAPLNTQDFTKGTLTPIDITMSTRSKTRACRPTCCCSSSYRASRSTSSDPTMSTG